MWEFNEVDRDNNYLAHASVHKYIERKWKNGRYVYRYLDDRFQKGSSPARVRNNYSARTAARRNSTVERSRNAKWNIAKLSTQNALDDDYKLFKDRKKFRNTAGVTHETALALNNHYKNKTKYLPTNTSRASNMLARREERNIIDKGLAEIASIKSKKSLKRKVKKAYYKTRDAVKSIPSPINTHKVYKAGNRTTVVDERGPLISTKSNRKSRKKKRG